MVMEEEIRVFATMVGSNTRVKFFIVLLFLLAFWCFGSFPQPHNDRSLDYRREIRYSSTRTRKLLGQGTKKDVKPNRMGDGCSADDIVIDQAATTPLPNGIPTYTVQILNLCIASGCRVGQIHLSCGWFSSARLVNPRLFRRLGFDDCLVNDGLPIPNGRSVSFQYANSFHYPLSVLSAVCLDP